MKKGYVGISNCLSKKYTKLTSAFLKMSIYPGIHKDPSVGAQT